MSISKWGLIGAGVLVLGSSACLLIYFLISWVSEPQFKNMSGPVAVVSGGPPPTHGVLGVRIVVEQRGIVVGEVLPGSSAETAGLRQYDVIRAIDGQPVVTEEDAGNVMARKKPGESVELDIRRDGEPMRIRVILLDFAEVKRLRHP